MANNSHLLRFNANKVRQRRAREYLAKSFRYLKKYAKTKRLSRAAELEYNEVKNARILAEYFSRFQEKALEAKKEREQY